MFLRTAKDNAPCRPLSHPPRRVAPREDFPRIQYWDRSSESDILKDRPENVISKELQKLGHHPTSPDKTRITIAYPHKAPSFWCNTPHRLVPYAQQLCEYLRLQFPTIEWIVADDLYERRHLNRRKINNQNSPKNFTQHQEFYYAASPNTPTIPFVDTHYTDRELFVLFDDIYYQGTTAINMINFIEHNGGYVLAAIASERPWNFSNDTNHLTQQTQRNANPELSFHNPNYYWGQIPKLAQLFHKAAQMSKRAKDLSHEDCLNEVEAVLNPLGHSLFTLTNGECSHLNLCINGYLTFHRRVQGLGYDGFLNYLSSRKPSF